MIRAYNLSKVYYKGKNRVEAVKSASLDIAKNDSVLITGPSGAGKSTLLHLLGGLDEPTRGKLYFEGKDFYRMADGERSRVRGRKVGFVFQFYHLLPEFSALENAMLPAMIAGRKEMRSARAIRGRARLLLKQMGLAGREAHKPSELSGGESQRVAIARSLINSPDVLLCDEPTGNLDSRIGREVMECIMEAKERSGMTLVVVSHDRNMHEGFARRFGMKDGFLENELVTEGIKR